MSYIISTKFLLFHPIQALWWHSSEEDVRDCEHYTKQHPEKSAGAKNLSKQEDWLHSQQGQANIIGLEWVGKWVLFSIRFMSIPSGKTQ